MTESWYHEQRGQYHVHVDKEDQLAVAAAVRQAAEAIKGADYVLVTAGAGMGVDSGLPDFRGGHSFWEGLKHDEIKRYEDMSDDSWFQRDPKLAWGLNAHQMIAYRTAVPHEGYEVLHRICSEKGPDKWFAYTSNVDGMFHAAGFDPERVVECHGQIHRLQCVRGRSCGVPENLSILEEMEWKSKNRERELWVAEALVELEYDEDYRVIDEASLPRCGLCGSLARPNIWFCADKNYTPYRPNSLASERYQEWRSCIRSHEGCRVVIIECGGGMVIPSVRCEGEILLEETQTANFTATLIRINPSDFGVPEQGAIGLPFGASEGLRKLEAEMSIV